MGKFMTFSAKAQEAFGSEDTYMNFSQLLTDTALGRQAVSKDEANTKIREMFSKVLGLPEGASKKEVRRAIQHNQREIFDIIEDVVEDLLVSGWADTEWFDTFVEMKNIALGDENEFYVEDDSVLTVSEVNGNSHNLIRQRLGAGESYKIKTSWYGVRLLSSLVA